MSDLETCPKTLSDNGVNCKVCGAPFKTLQDCLAHELLKHAVKPQKKLRKCLDAITKLFASDQIRSERRSLQESLVQTQPGQHLRAFLGFYAGNCTALADCFSDVRKNIQKQLQFKVKVYPFGSLVTGLALKDSDIDLYLEQVDYSSNNMTHRQLFNKIDNYLRRSDCFSDVFAIRHARVPIIRCKHVMSGLSIDINMSNPNSTYNSRFVAELLNRDVRLRELFLFLKIWAKKLKIIGSGSMTSYCLITLIIYQLQQLRHLPSIKQLQSTCPAEYILGINYAYCLQNVRPLPASLTTFDLIISFFELYSHMNFEKMMLSPYLGHSLDVETAFSVPENFPEYKEQMMAVQRITGQQPEEFQSQRCVCVQDPFELQHNVGQTISQMNLCYLKQCLLLAAQACKDEKLKSVPAKFYDYLLFGLAESLMQEQRLEHLQPAKVRKQGQKALEKHADSAATKPSVAATTEPPVAATGQSAATVVESTDDKLTANSPVENITPLKHVHTLIPTNNDLKSLRVDFLNKKPKAKKPKQTIYYFWSECYVEAIKDILSNIYDLNMEEIEATKISSADKLPRRITWLISTTLDTWSARNFQRASKQSFFAQQLQQTIEFRKTRTENVNYSVNLNGRFSLVISPDYKELRLELQSMSRHSMDLQKNSPLTKFFKSLKNMLCNYNFREKVISLQCER